MILAIISVPVWIAAAMTFLLGMVGTFSPEIRGRQAHIALLYLIASPALAYVACKMCGLVP